MNIFFIFSKVRVLKSVLPPAPAVQTVVNDEEAMEAELEEFGSGTIFLIINVFYSFISQ